MPDSFVDADKDTASSPTYSPSSTGQEEYRGIDWSIGSRDSEPAKARHSSLLVSLWNRGFLPAEEPGQVRGQHFRLWARSVQAQTRTA